ncbi:trypco2 family protein [Streptomyces sp. WAC01526]|uniref:trypco2 family protein n=1 Tax=Streptomyces sp. WAC01526 TaxID=2588709 RepID=UPI0011DFB9D9|nr:trypco2 family protein [Streptomyces sp. WAC01526]
MIELSDMIRQLRHELITAMADGRDEAIRFELGPIEIEATVTVDREAGANGKVRFWVVEAGSNGKYAQSRTQRITLTLQPKDVAPDGAPRTALITGAEADGER